uniref:Putative secreted protein n=1 Tax=Anopheles marajoara TaxID=58244 RepID=A0A2M4CAC0_9DIPT
MVHRIVRYLRDVTLLAQMLVGVVAEQIAGTGPNRTDHTDTGRTGGTARFRRLIIVTGDRRVVVRHRTTHARCQRVRKVQRWTRGLR